MLRARVGVVLYPLFGTRSTVDGRNLAHMSEPFDELTAQIKRVLESGQTWYGDFDPNDGQGISRAKTAGIRAAWRDEAQGAGRHN